MSSLDNLMDLIQTTNEVYFITAPGRVRTAYILVDDIVELALKTFLQEKALTQRNDFKDALDRANIFSTDDNQRNAQRNILKDYFAKRIDQNNFVTQLGLNPTHVQTLNNILAALRPLNMLQHWSVTDIDEFKNYPQVIGEVKKFFAAGSPTWAMLDEANSRHQVRNKFYHDHRQIGLTIDDDKCLRALCEMFNLFEQLFPDFRTKVQSSHTVRCQIGVLRLKLAAHSGANELVKPYNAALEQLKQGHHYDNESRSVEHSLVHTVSYRFFHALREQFIAAIGQLQLRADKINQMARPQAKHLSQIADIQKLIAILQSQLTDIESLL